jgi:hypothetical protein
VYSKLLEWYSVVHYRVYKSPPLISVHNLWPEFCNILRRILTLWSLLVLKCDNLVIQIILLEFHNYRTECDIKQNYFQNVAVIQRTSFKVNLFEPTTSYECQFQCTRVYPNFPDWVGNEIYVYLWYYSLVCPLQRVMAARLTTLTHRLAIQLHLVAESCTAVLAPGGQSENFWIHTLIAPTPNIFVFVRQSFDIWP